ncbi:MAG: hypothetical protein QOJ99_5344 [Bryobacterales bacterium]|jgi:hypothetical protein|nr:hypothetical protein [Bryobacterales bacterium]
MKTLLSTITALLVLVVAGHSATITYIANLSGPNESPVNPSPGIGFGSVTVDDIANTMLVNVQFSGLVSGTAASHIHCCTPTPFTGTAGVATAVPTFPNFPLGVTSGTYQQLFDLTSAATYNPAFVTANGGTALSAEAVLLAGMAAGETYLNIHTATSPGGEIRGFLVATPEPVTILLAGAVLIGLGLRRKRR